MASERNEKSIGVVIVDHGSRRGESNDQLVEVVEAYRRHSGQKIVEAAHMELAEPSIATAFARCVAQGSNLVVVVPYFLAPGKHWNDDIPGLAASAASSHPGVRHVVAPPLGLHPLMLRIIDERIADGLANDASTA